MFITKKNFVVPLDLSIDSEQNFTFFCDGGGGSGYFQAVIVFPRCHGT